MSAPEDLHHIRLAVGIEVDNSGQGLRTLTKSDCERLAADLANDLARLEPSASQGLLVVGGVLFEPGEALRPGLPAWEALIDLSKPVAREHGLSGKLLAIGSHQGRMPDARLHPPIEPPQGQFLVLPLLLALPPLLAEDIRQSLEDKLFEQGGVHPPGRARLAEASGWPNSHAQLLTANDLIALQHVQMDSAGLGAFWPIVEHVLIDPTHDQDFSLPGDLQARWKADDQALTICFVSFDQHGGGPDDYALWVRAFRSLDALLESHGIARKTDSSLVLDPSLDCLIEAGGPCPDEAGLTEHIHADCGLIAWTLVDDGHQANLFPLSGQAIARVQQELGQRKLQRKRSSEGICYDPDTCKLVPAR